MGLSSQKSNTCRKDYKGKFHLNVGGGQECVPQKDMEMDSNHGDMLPHSGIEPELVAKW